MTGSRARYIFIVVSITCILLQSWIPLTVELHTENNQSTSGRDVTIWTGGEQPWPQFGNNPTRNSTAPAHSPNGGFSLETLGTITEPTINWKGSADDSYGVQSLGTAIADFSGQISGYTSSFERCGLGNLFAVYTIERNSGSENDWLVIVEGGLNREAWRVDLGETSDVKSTPGIVDVNGDGILEVIVAYDTSSGLTIDVWSPQLSCSEAGTWNADQHSNELMWTYTEPDLNLGIAADSFNAGHLASTQALIADLQLDGIPELVLSTVDDISERPTIVAIPLSNSAPNQPLWQIQLDYGTHPSDPTWVQIDEENSAVLVTTIDADDGNMWAWRINAETGSLDWNARSLISEGDSGVPHIRLPGPVIAQLDDDALPEVIFTAPGDWDENSPVDAASYHAWELTDGSEIWSYTAPNGYAETPPIPVDIDNDGIHEYICWATWFENGVLNSDRHGRIGCEDVTGDTAGWWGDMEPSDGNSNDGIALSQPIAVDINGIGAPEIIIAYGQSLRAYDGDDGSSDIWENDIDLGKRSWASPALADLDGDGILDILIGDVLVSQANIDIAPILDNRGIRFSPSAADPGDLVEITVQYANQGTISSDEPVDAWIYIDNELVSTNRILDMETAAPSGNAIDSSFTIQWTATLGTHEIRLELDPNNNLTQSRIDNDNYSIQFTVVEPYDLAISLPPEPTRINPGESELLDINILAIGRRSAEWSMNINSSNMPENWTVVDQQPNSSQSITIDPEGDIWGPEILVSVPISAEGSDSGSFLIIMTLDSDPSITKSFMVPIEVNRTRGLSITGPDGNAITTGHGIRGNNATAWFQIENLGNAEERLTSQTWSSNNWQSDPLIFDVNGGPYYSITLSPGEKKEFIAVVAVPENIGLGSIAENTFSACIGTEENSLCKSIEFRFISNLISMHPPHIKSIPGVDLSWELHSNSSEGDLIIDLASAGMAHSGWQWTAEGHGVLNGNILNISVRETLGITWLNVSIPNQSPPLLHTINSEIETSVSLNFSINLLQVNRAEVNVVDPSTNLIIIDVNTVNSLIVKLTNKGNGEDTFKLNAEFIGTGDVKNNPGIEFSIPQSTFTLGVDTSVFPTIDYSISEDTPAGQTVMIRISITSTIDWNLYEFTDVAVTAKQHHNWSISNVSGLDFYASHNELINITFNVTNTGNLVDIMEWSSTTSTIQHENDTTAWNANIEPEKVLNVNETSTFEINIIVPNTAWEGSVFYYNLSLISDTNSVAELSFKITTQRSSGWSLKLTDSDLDVHAFGSNISIEIENKGNSIVEPILLPVLPTGWNITKISSMTAIEPGKSFSVDLHVIPPTNSMAGEIGIMTLIVKDGDTLQGRSEIGIPLRVASIYSMEVGHENEWIVSSEGGFPLAWIKNTGNALSEITMVLDAPDGWEVISPMKFYVPPGAIKGLPISLIPPANWDKSNHSQIITLIDSTGAIQNITLNVKSYCCGLDVSWGVSPVFVGYTNDAVEIIILGGESQYNSILELTSTGTFQYQYCKYTDSNDCIEELSYKALVIQKTDLEGTCEFNDSIVTYLESGIDINDETIASCEFSTTPEEIRWNILLRIDGELISSISGIHSGNMTKHNLSLNSWTIESGEHHIEIEIYDGFGKLVDSESKRIIIRHSGWNIGISSIDISSDNQDLTINMRRENYEQLLDVHCVLSASAGTGSDAWNTAWKIDMAKGQLAPTLTIPRPNITSGEYINFELNCVEPWHIDDNMEDNSYAYLVPKINTPIIEANEWIWGVMSLIILLAAAKVLGFIELKPKRIQKQTNKEKLVSKPEVLSKNEHIEENINAIHLEVNRDENEKSDIEDKDINEIVEENQKEETGKEDEIVEVSEVEEEPPKIEEDMDTKISRMMSRKRYYE